MLKKLSVSSIESFDNSTAFGCEAKWWYEYVKGLRGPPDKNQALGELVHKTIEDYLLTGVNGLHRIALPGKQYIDSIRPHVLKDRRGKPMVEYWFDKGVEYAGLPLRGKIDVVVAEGDDIRVVDWKTTSSIERYAKTISQAQQSVQLHGYAAVMFSLFPQLYSVPVTLAYFDTKQRNFEPVEAIITKEDIAAKKPETESKVEKMKAAALLSSPEALKPNLSACEMGRRICPHHSYCPHYKPKEELTMGMLDFFNTDKTPTVEIPAPADTAPARPSNVESAPPPPPAAPPTEKKKAKKALAEQTATLEDDVTVVVTPGPKTVEVPTFSIPAETVPVKRSEGIIRMAIRHGLTLNLGNYESARVEVELEAVGKFTEEELSNAVREQLYKEASVYKRVGKKEEK